MPISFRNILLLSSVWLLTNPLIMAKERKTLPSLDRPITDEIFYFLMTDRFQDGDKQNNKGLDHVPVEAADTSDDIVRHGYDPKHEAFYHGGDFRGVADKLDYLKKLGITSIWLSPIQKNRPTQVGDSPLGVISGYHGYWVMDFTTVDPHWGTEEDFKNLVDRAHEKGIKIFMDVIVNHTADVISYRECIDCPYRSREEFPYRAVRRSRMLNDGFIDGLLTPENYDYFKDSDYAYHPFLSNSKLRKKPEWLNEFVYYHNRGNSRFSGESSELGDFYGLDDLNTEHPTVVKGMIEIYGNWIRRYRIDGFRLDTAKHVNIEFWQEFIPAMHRIAAEVEISNFYIFGEVFSQDPSLLSRYTRLGEMDSVLDFPLQNAIKEVFANGENPQFFENSFLEDDLHRLQSNPNKMMSFLSSHDVGRIAHFIRQKFSSASESEILQRVQLAHSYLFLTRGIPVLYYGDEQGFLGNGTDHASREDMFPSQTPLFQAQKSIAGGKANAPNQNHFDEAHPLYQTIQALSALRKQEHLLRTGDYESIPTSSPNLLSFLRRDLKNREEILVAFNLDAKRPQQLALPNGRWKSLYPDRSRGFLKQRTELQPLSVLVLKGQTSSPRPLAIDKVELLGPAENQRVSGLFYLELKPSEQNPVEVRFSIKGPDDKDFRELYKDTNSPYRAYINGQDFRDGSPIKVQAEIMGRKGIKAKWIRSLLIDSRPIRVELTYENGNKRDSVYRISSTGWLTAPEKLASDGRLSFEWPLNEESQLVVFSGPSEAEDGIWLYDKPIKMTLKDHILPNTHPGPQGEPTAKLAIDNLQEISTGHARANHSLLPPVIKQNEASSSATGPREIFARGTMNAWQADEPMKPRGASTYRSTFKLASGLTEFKFADKNWTGEANWGAPIQSYGLTASGKSGNLRFEVPKGQVGRYDFDLILVPAQDWDGKQELVLGRVQKTP